ncbi:MAG: glycosyltransferase family 2 protein [Patescibacteria group bacterium]
MVPKVFIIIINWNGREDTLECLESLKNNDYLNYEVVIIDNGSKDKFQVSDSKIKVIYNKENLGFSGGNNVGIKYALENNADYVLLLNNDTIVSKDFLSKMVEVAENNNKIGIIGPKIYFPDSKKIWFAGGKINWLYNKGTMRGFNKIDKGQYDEPKVQKTDYITGCCALIKKEVLEKIGLMPEEYFLYYEDTDWSLKARQMGYKCIFIPSAIIWHKGSKSAINGSPSYIYYHIRNGLIMARKYAPWYIKPFIYLDILFRIKKQIIKYIFMPKKRIWAKYILLGIKDFYFNKKGKIDENWS